MSQPARRGRPRRTEELASQSTVRRSPRISNRLSQVTDSHQLHRYQVSSRASLGGGGRGRRSISRSVTPSNIILNESGQSVPISEADEATGVPPHLYGLDEHIEVEYTGSGGTEPTRWNVYNKERVLISTPSDNQYDYAENPGIIYRIFRFFTACLFELGSFLYLAATAILCLDVIVLHRLFNFSSVSQRAGSISRFFLLLLALFALIGFLIGGHFFPVAREQVAKVNASETDLRILVDDISKIMGSRIDMEMRDFESRFKRDLDARINTVIDSRVAKLALDLNDRVAGGSERLRQSLLQLREDLMKEFDEFKNHEIAILRASLESRISELPGHVDELRSSLEPEITTLRQGQNELLNTARQKFDGLTDKQERLILNVSAALLQLERHNGRISVLEENMQGVLKEISSLKAKYAEQIREATMAMNESVPAYMVAEIFNRELEKATSDSNSPLRLWLDLVFASKNDVQEIQSLIDKIMTCPGCGGTSDVTRNDVEQMIAIALRKYSADRIGKFDFALESSGGSIMLNYCSPTYAHTMTSVTLLGVIPLWHYMSTPKVIIEPSMYPGNCWAMEGQSGFATIKLRSEVVITGVTVDHIPQELSPNGTLDTTPKDFVVQGLAELGEKPMQLGTFSYRRDGEPIQQFDVKQKNPMAYHFVRFEFISNYGNTNYTCVYRVRVHGHYP